MSQIKTKFISNLAITNPKIANATIDLTTKVTGLLPPANGGANSATYVPQTAVGAANGVASLDSGSKIPVAQLPSTVMLYLGAWNASTNTPTLADGTGVNGDLYRVSVAGTQNLGSGSQTFFVGDFIIYNGTIWQRSPAADGVISVNGTSGAVTVNAINQLTGDITTSAASQSQSLAATLATVNSNVGSFTNSSITVNAKGLITAASNGTAPVTSISVASANGLAGSSSGGATPALTLSTTITGVLQGNGTAISAAATTGSGSVVLATAPTLSNPIVGTQSQGDSSTKGASTAYVDTAIANAIAGVNPAIAVQAATTAASDTSSFTYNNGAAGIGATLTGATNTAVTFDGFTFTTLGQRALVKNDTQSPSGAFNGIYYVTQVQTSLLPPILTRALDYDQPSDINNTGAIPVINGTVNGTTQWVLTSSVTTVGTSPLTFTIFTKNPASYASSTLTQNHILVGSASNIATDVAMSGDMTIVASGATTLATVNGNVGSFGSSTSIPSLTVNAKGLITAASGNAVIAPAGTLSGTTLNSTVVSSSLTSVGTLVSGTWNASVISSTYVGLGKTINAQSGTTYTFVLADGSAAGGSPLVTASNASAQTYTVPTNASVAFPIGTQIDLMQQGAGKVTVVAAGGVTVNSQGGLLSIAAQYVGVSLVKTATDTWTLLGNLIA